MKRWTEKEINYLKHYYPKRGGKWVADRIDRTEKAVLGMAHRLSIKHCTTWSKEEIQRLEELSEKYTKADIAKKLGRSSSSVNNKRNFIAAGTFLENTDLLLLKDVAEMVGLDKAIITKIWCMNGLKSEKRGYYRVFKEEDLVEFMKNNPNRYNARRCDKYMFQKYDWFMKKMERG